MTQQFGIVGRPLGHSFSKKYFSEKFIALGIDASYDNFELNTISEFPELIKNNPSLCGLSVTIPYKELVMPFLDEMDEQARAAGAVNTIRIRDGKTKGFNTDVSGFAQSLETFYEGPENGNVLILGTGGAAKSVLFAVQKFFSFSNVKLVSRISETGKLSYEELKHASLRGWNLIVNATPVGMFPAISECPDISFSSLSSGNYLFDLIYNPTETEFLKRGRKKGCPVKNGLEMLHLQAEAAWVIWNR